MIPSTETKRELAKKRVEEIKGFFRHLKVFIVINGSLYLLKLGWLNALLPNGFPIEPYYYDWIWMNILIWGLILAIHGLTLYRHRFTFLKKWEERQIKKYMEEEQSEAKKYK
ncbi:MAG: 2TM domain-containing protein [Croceivirga sp.]